MPFKRTPPRVHVKVNDTKSIAPQKSYTVNSTPATSNTARKRFWDQLSLHSFSKRQNSARHFLSHHTAPIGLEREIDEVEYNEISKSAPGGFTPFEIDKSLDFYKRPSNVLSIDIDDEKFETESQKIEQERLAYEDRKNVVKLSEKLNSLNFESQQLYEDSPDDEELQNDGEIISRGTKVKIKYRGFVMAGFTFESLEFPSKDVEYMKFCLRALESLFTTK